MKMTGDYKWLKDLKDADFMYGGEQFVITEEDIERLKKGEVLNFFVNMEYGCTLSYAPTADNVTLINKAKACIIALRCHADPDFCSCSQCPYKEDPDCFSQALEDTILYIDKLIVDSYDSGYTAGLHDAMQDYKEGSDNE